MTNSLNLKKVRKALKKTIAMNPIIVALERTEDAKLVDNGFGKMVSDPHAAKKQVVVTFKLAHDKGGSPVIAPANGFWDSNYDRIAVWAYDTDIREGDTFQHPDIDTTLEFADVDSLREFGGVKGYQAKLRMANSSASQPQPAYTSGSLIRPIEEIPDLRGV